jgi:hypothetical protein
MLSELGAELLDLTVIEKGVGSALYAVESGPDPGCGSGGSCSWTLSCSCTI